MLQYVHACTQSLHLPQALSISPTYARTRRATVQQLQAQIDGLSAKLSESSRQLAAAAAAAAAEANRRAAREAELVAEAARRQTGPSAR